MGDIVPVETTKEHVRVRVRNPGDFKSNTFKTLTLSESEGISSGRGRLKSNNEWAAQNFMFRLDKGWTEAKAEKWVKDHGYTPRNGETMKTKVLPMEFRAEFSPESINKESRTVELIWSKGAKVLRAPWFGEPYYEELDLKPESVRLKRLNNGAPLLNTHKNSSLENIMGVVEKAWLDGDSGKAKVRFSERQDVEPFWQDVKSGIIRNVSVGYRVHKFKEVEGDDEKVKTLRATDWEPFEVSLVPIGADAAASIRKDLDENEVEIEYMERKEMENTETKTVVTEAKAPEAAPQVETKTVAAPVVEPKQNETERALEILQAVRSAKLEGELAEKLIKENKTMDEVKKVIIDEVGKRDNVEINKAQVGVDISRAARLEGMQEVILHRARPTEHTVSEKGKQFVGMTLVDMGREMLEKTGVNTRGYSRHDLAHRILASTDFPELLAGVTNKSLRKGYEAQPQTFKPFVVEATLPDFKEASRIAFGEAPNLALVAEGDDFDKTGTISEAAEKYSLSTYGKIIPFTFQMLVNDDLSAVSRIPFMFGAAAARLESKLVYTDTLIGNPAMSDTKALFHADHGNLGTGSVIDETNLSLAKKAIRNQTGLDAVEYLDLIPAFLIVGPAYEVSAQKMLSAIVANTTDDINVFANSMKLIVESRVTGNKWFIACAPSQIDTLEIGYLDGMRGPQLSTYNQWDNDSVEFKCKHVVGVKAIDWRSMYYNPGA